MRLVLVSGTSNAISAENIKSARLQYYSVGEVWASLMTSKTIFCAGSILRNIPRAKKQIGEENVETTSKLRLESCTTQNVLLEARNHGRSEEDKKIILESCHAGPSGMQNNLAIVYKDFNQQSVGLFLHYRWPGFCISTNLRCSNQER